MILLGWRLDAKYMRQYLDVNIYISSNLDTALYANLNRMQSTREVNGLFNQKTISFSSKYRKVHRQLKIQMIYFASRCYPQYGFICLTAKSNLMMKYQFAIFDYFLSLNRGCQLQINYPTPDYIDLLSKTNLQLNHRPIIMANNSSLTIMILVLVFLFIFGHCGYIPQLQMCASTTFVNKQLTKYGPTIQKQLDTAKIPDQSFDDKFEGVNVHFNLTNIKQKFGINWNANVIKINDANTFTLMMKNINMTIDAHIQFKIGAALKQKGTLIVIIEKMEADTTLRFTQPHCSFQGQGLGFDLQIQKVFVNTEKFTIRIQGKGVDNLIIRAVMSVLKSRLPGIIEKAALQKGNPAISKMTCSPVQQVLSVGQGSYVAIINTTNVPHFKGVDLYASIDLTLTNLLTNATNNQVQNDNLPQENMFAQRSELSLLASSNMMNTILWLVQDSKLINVTVTNDMLGPNPPIELNTLNLSILIPGLTKWKKKQVVLLVTASNRYSHLYIRNGKIVTALSVSVKFVVNNTGVSQPISQCIKKGDCIVACDLNITLPFSAAMRIDEGSVLRGLVHTVGIQDIKVISAEIDVRTESLKKILNTMVGSFRPQINKQIQDGKPLDISKLEKFQVEEILMNVKKDYAAIGLIFKK